MDFSPFNQNMPIEDETPEVDEAEVRRKAIASKRIFFLLVITAIILVGLLVWEGIEISLGGRP